LTWLHRRPRSMAQWHGDRRQPPPAGSPGGAAAYRSHARRQL